MEGGTQVVVPHPSKQSAHGAPAKRAHDPVTVVILGASGDLAKRKLIPALFQLERAGYLPEAFAVVGFARSEMTDAGYRDAMGKALREAVPAAELTADPPLLNALYYSPGDNTDVEAFRRLKAKLEAVERERGLPGNRLFYLSVAPEFFGTIIRNPVSYTHLTLPTNREV